MNTQTRTHTHTHTHTHTRTRTHARTHARTRARVHTRTGGVCLRIHTFINKHVFINTYAYLQLPGVELPFEGLCWHFRSAHMEGEREKGRDGVRVYIHTNILRVWIAP